MGKFNQSVTRHAPRYEAFQMRGSVQLSSLASKIYGTILWKSMLSKAFIWSIFYHYEKTLTKTNSETKWFIFLMLQVPQQGSQGRNVEAGTEAQT